jgi:hypothetical protein
MKVRLHEAIHYQGRVHERGEIIEVPDDWKIPLRAQRKSHDRIDYSTDPPIDANHTVGEFEDVPLAEAVDDEGKPLKAAAAEQEKPA